ncbi:MAG: M64 family metallopeptidase [Bacteroidales bacterium]|nr:M64 family metallopeptidase [Bacteroidales bacterium]
MKRILLTISFLGLLLQLTAQFDSVFYNKSLRMDYIRSGNSENEWIALENWYEQADWAGSENVLIDPLGYGKHWVEMRDAATDSVLYSRGYGSLFSEWQTTAEAKETVRSFPETVVMPYPKMPVQIRLLTRTFQGDCKEVFSIKLGPENYFIKPAPKMKWPVMNVWGDGDAADVVDIVVLPDGYTMEELGEFMEDARFFAESIFQFEPFRSLKDKFRIRAVLAPSDESGIPVPAEDFWPQTALGSSFYTFDSERYCMSYDNRSIRDLAGQVPYDQIYILANTTKYGGGGIYNYYGLSSAGNQLSSKVIVHEFGHSFAGLGDEYFDSSTAYSDFYNLETEPWEPNLTTLVDFDSKWKSLMDTLTPVPTPAVDSMRTVLGVYEGGGYVAKGMYRPMIDCLMHTFKGEEFCPACKHAIIQMIEVYSE